MKNQYVGQHAETKRDGMRFIRVAIGCWSVLVVYLKMEMDVATSGYMSCSDLSSLGG